MFLIHFKRFILWIMATVLIGIVISLASIFSRELTLNTVKINEFKIYYSFLNQETKHNEVLVKSQFDILLSPKKFPLLPIALIGKDTCIDNVNKYYNDRFNLSICNNLSYNQLKSNEIEVQQYYDSQIIVYKKQYFLFKELEHTNSFLVARINDYYAKNDFSRFLIFLSSKEGLSWLTSYNSFQTFLSKTQFIWFILLPLSVVLYLVLTMYFLNKTKKFNALNFEKEQLVQKWGEINNDIKNLSSEQDDLETKINEQGKNSIASEVSLEDLQSKLDVVIEKKNNLIKSLKAIEEKEEILFQKINNALKNITTQEKENILKNIQVKQSQIDQLWKYTPTWQERHLIENNVSLRDDFTPFTISQAFICFEQIIESIVVKINDEYKDKNLIEQINIIFENNLWPAQFEQQLHSIRIARNKWFHHGKEPSKEVFISLLDVLDKTNTRPLL